jgi:hypothetical protein
MKESVVIKKNVSSLYLLTRMHTKNCDITVEHDPGQEVYTIKLTKEECSASNNITEELAELIIADYNEMMISEEELEKKEDWTYVNMFTTMIFWLVGNLSKDYFLTIGD